MYTNYVVDLLICIGSLAKSTSGTITSPGYPGLYPVNSNKEWLINATSNAAEIVIIIHDQDIHQTRGFPCDDFLKVFIFSKRTHKMLS